MYVTDKKHNAGLLKNYRESALNLLFFGIAIHFKVDLIGVFTF